MRATRWLVSNAAGPAVSGSDGRYAIAGVAPGSYTVRAQRIGYSPQSRAITVVAGQSVTADFQLDVLATLLSEVVSVGYTTQSRASVSEEPTSLRPASAR